MYTHTEENVEIFLKILPKFRKIFKNLFCFFVFFFSSVRERPRASADRQDTTDDVRVDATAVNRSSL